MRHHLNDYVMNQIRYWVYKYKSLLIEKKMRIPLIFGTIPFVLIVLATTFFPIYWPITELIVFTIWSLSLIVTGLLMLFLKKNALIPEAPILAYPMGAIMTLGGFYGLVHGISNLIVQLRIGNFHVR